jgi:hypothetical protein
MTADRQEHQEKEKPHQVQRTGQGYYESINA